MPSDWYRSVIVIALADQRNVLLKLSKARDARRHEKPDADLKRQRKRLERDAVAVRAEARHARAVRLDRAAILGANVFGKAIGVLLDVLHNLRAHLCVAQKVEKQRQAVKLAVAVGRARVQPQPMV